MALRRSRRSAGDRSLGGGQSLLQVRARGTAARLMEERIAVGDIPVGLTVEEYQRRIPGIFDGLAQSTKKAYGGFLSSFESWCDSRGICLHDIETDHVITYLEQARERSVKPVGVSWLRSSIAAVQRGLEFHVGRGEVDGGRWACGWMTNGGRSRRRRSVPMVSPGRCSSAWWMRPGNPWMGNGRRKRAAGRLSTQRFFSCGGACCVAMRRRV